MIASGPDQSVVLTLFGATRRIAGSPARSCSSRLAAPASRPASLGQPKPCATPAKSEKLVCSTRWRPTRKTAFGAAPPRMSAARCVEHGSFVGATASPDGPNSAGNSHSPLMGASPLEAAKRRGRRRTSLKRPQRPRHARRRIFPDMARQGGRLYWPGKNSIRMSRVSGRTMLATAPGLLGRRKYL